MKHRVSGRKLGRTSAHRLAVLRNLSTDLFERERIRTTLMKAKELRPFAERLITLSKNGSLHSRRQAARQLTRPRVVQKLFDTLSARYAERPGGYTRILKLGPRRGDNAEMAILELIGSEPKPSTPSGDGGEKKQKKVLGRLRDRLTRGKQAPAGGTAAAGAEGGPAASGAGSPGMGAGRPKRSSKPTRPVKGQDTRAAGRKGGTKKPSGD